MASPCVEPTGAYRDSFIIGPTVIKSMATTRRTRRRRPLPLITLPLVILAASSSLAVAAAVQRDVLAPQITTPAVLDKSIASPILDYPSTAMSPTVLISATKIAGEVGLELRAPKTDDGAESTAKRSDDSKITSTNSVEAEKTTAAETEPTPSPLPSPLPSPFDNPAPSAFQVPGGDATCPRFMSNLFSDPNFKSCYPMSMLIQTSTGLFNAEKQLVSIVKVLDATCKADVVSCTEFLDKAAKNLTSSGNCKTEFQQNQSQVLQAYRGLLAYKVLYAASCLQDPSSNMYCFANAVTNLSTVSDSYLYSMPFGTALPGASTPTCNWCTQNTMSIFHAASADRRQFVASTYESAARQVNTICGPQFVNSTLPSASGGRSIAIPSHVGVFMNACIALVAFTWLL